MFALFPLLWQGLIDKKRLLNQTFILIPVYACVSSLHVIPFWHMVVLVLLLEIYHFSCV